MNQPRLFMQLQAFGGCTDVVPMCRALHFAELDGVLYKEVSDPNGIGLLVMSEDAEVLTGKLRDLFCNRPFKALTRKPDHARLGTTCTQGGEEDPEDALVERPRGRALNPKWPWAIWYAVRYRAEFAALSVDEQIQVRGEHVELVRELDDADIAHRVRLSCFGLDWDGNDFVIGLMGKELHEISGAVERLRGTTLATRYVEQRGPFFLGQAVWRTGSGTTEGPDQLEGARW